jgi:hypothetical protein
VELEAGQTSAAPRSRLRYHLMLPYELAVGRTDGAIDARCCRRLLKPDVEDLPGNPLTEVPEVIGLSLVSLDSKLMANDLQASLGSGTGLGPAGTGGRYKI